MAAYVKLTDYSVKDGLNSGNPSKVVKGTEIDDEFNALVASDSDNHKKSNLTAEMNAFITNPTLQTLEEAINYDLVEYATAASYINVLNAVGGETVVLTPTYALGINSVTVWLNGVRLELGPDFTETDTTHITLANALSDGDKLTTTTYGIMPLGVTSSNAVQYSPAGTGAVATNVQDKLREVPSNTDYSSLADALTANDWVQYPSSTAFTLTKNTSAPPSLIDLPAQSDVVHLVGKDAADTGVLLDTFGTGVNPRLYMRRSRGTNASKTAVQDGDNLGVFEIQAHDGTAYSTDYDALISAVADGNWTTGSHGVKWKFEATPSGSANAPQTCGYATWRGFESYVSGNTAIGQFVRNVSTGSSAYSVTYYGDADSESHALIGVVCKNNTAYAGAKSFFLGTNGAYKTALLYDAAAVGYLGASGIEDAGGYANGSWYSQTFAAGDFTANNSMTWTVASGDVGTFKYNLYGKRMTVAFTINTSTVGGTPSTLLQIKIPASKTAAALMYNPIVLLDNGVRVMGYAYTQSGGTNIFISRLDGGNFAAASDTTYVLGEITFEIQ